MDKYKFMECNSAGNCFFVCYSNNGNNYTIGIYTDEECTDCIESYTATIEPNHKWDDDTKKAYIEQVITDSVRRVIEYY